MWGGLHVICVDVVAAAAHRTTVGISALLQHRGRQVWKRLSNNSIERSLQIQLLEYISRPLQRLIQRYSDMTFDAVTAATTAMVGTAG